jgi:hypothetical protein
MPRAIGNIEKRSPGRPRVDATPVLVRLQPATLAIVDRWAAKHGTTRPEAIRGMIEAVVRLGGLDE